MYNYPYGDSQQINLNWIISEIIALHQQLDPDYTAPTFTQIYPFSDAQQLNLDWILTELKALKDLVPTPPPTEEIDEIGQALIAGAYDADTLYQKNDYIVQDGKVYRANAATTGTFDPTKWNEALLGNDLAIITRWADATNTFLNSLAASDVANDSSVTGTTVKDALNNLNTTLLHETLRDTKTAITVDPPSIDAIKDYDTGLYRVAVSNTTVFPHGYGVLEIIKAQDYGIARFSNMNVSYPATWIVQWNTNSGSWYFSTWTDEQKYIKELTAQLPVANGGTGATTAADARKNVGLCYATNDTESSNASNPLSGFLSTISNVARTLYLEYVVEKSLENITSVTVLSLTGQLFGVAGAIDGGTSTDFTSDVYTATAVKLSNKRLRITITKTTAFSNATALTPVVFWGSISLKFT